jgi:hypothetical protein
MTDETKHYDPSYNQALVVTPPQYPSIEELISIFVKEKETAVMLYKYAENDIISEFHDYIDKTYEEHYKTNEKSIECFDAWIALGNSTDTFRNTALKYLWRYGKKNGNNKADLMKALHYTLMCLYVDHYKDGK